MQLQRRLKSADAHVALSLSATRNRVRFLLEKMALTLAAAARESAHVAKQY